MLKAIRGRITRATPGCASGELHACNNATQRGRTSTGERKDVDILCNEEIYRLDGNAIYQTLVLIHISNARPFGYEACPS